MTLHRWDDAGPLTCNELYDLYDDAPSSYVRAGFVASVDGAVAVDASSRPLSGPADLTALRVLRSVSDVVLVGAETARSQAYGPLRLRDQARQWRASAGRSAAPVLAVVSRSLQLPARLFDDGHRPLVLTCTAADRGRRDALAERADVVDVGGERVDLARVAAVLADRGLHRVLCEGGPTLLGGLLDGGSLDELCLTVSPLLAGRGATLLPTGLHLPISLTLRHVLHADGMLMLRYLLPQGDRLRPERR